MVVCKYPTAPAFRGAGVFRWRLRKGYLLTGFFDDFHKFIDTERTGIDGIVERLAQIFHRVIQIFFSVSVGRLSDDAAHKNSAVYGFRECLRQV